MCSTLRLGAWALVGSIAPRPAVLSFSRTFHMPFITDHAPFPAPPPGGATFRTPQGGESRALVLYVRPSYEEALLAVVRHYRWTHIYYVYDSLDGKWVLAIGPNSQSAGGADSLKTKLFQF